MSTEERVVTCRRAGVARKRVAPALALVGALSIGAAGFAESDPAGFVHWPASHLKGYARKLAPKINAQKVASERIGEFGNHWMEIAHRQGDGEAELHEAQADVFVVQSGEATLVVGGEMVAARTTAAGQLRGPGIKGGVRKRLAQGDVVHIPPRTPHQLLVENGKQFNYFVVKIDSPSPAAASGR